jgi:hypothetical protein
MAANGGESVRMAASGWERMRTLFKKKGVVQNLFSVPFSEPFFSSSQKSELFKVLNFLAKTFSSSRLSS